jgi:APA family basic amino acid/polyamine antiporter
LHRAYGRSLAFLFGWARYTVITTGSIALLAFVFGDYVQQALPLGPLIPLMPLTPRTGATVYAAAAVLVLALINLRGLRSGSTAQNWLTLVEVGGLLLLVATALALAAQPAGPAPAAAAPHAAASTGPPAFGLAMVFVLLTYGGWNEAAYISAELHAPARNIVRALVLSVAAVTALYLAVCWAYWHVLGMPALAASAAPAADLLQRGLGPAGAHGIALIVAVSALTSINATMIVGARTGYALGRDWRPLGWLARWDGVRAAPSTAMVAQCAAALLLVLVGGSGDGFRAMVEFTAPVFWLFFLLTGVALFVLRRRDPTRTRPYRVPLYPWLPLLFCISCACMLWSSLAYVSSQSLGGLNAAWVGVGVLAVGAALLGALLLASGRLPLRHPGSARQRRAIPTFAPKRKDKRR